MPGHNGWADRRVRSRPRQNGVRALLRGHQHGKVRVGTGHDREDRGIHHTQSFKPMHPQLRIDHGFRVVAAAHLAGAAGVEDRAASGACKFEQRRIALAKAPLFFIALEDTYGEASVRQGLAQVVRLLRGQEVGYQDIRAAIENVTNKDLAPIFRTWLYKPGIPAEFREEYQSAGAGKN